MDTIKIKTFLEVAEHKSFSHVARGFSYTPSAVSHMADALETELGVRLFERTRKGVELTPDGKKLYDYFAAFDKAEKALFTAAQKLAREKQESLHIGAFSSVALHILPDVLQSFRMKYPHIKTSLLVEDDIWYRLKDGTLDVVLADEYNIDKTAQWDPIMEDAYMVAAPEAFFENATTVSKEDLYQYPLIHMDDDALRKYLNYSHFKEKISVSSIENETAISMVRRGMGIAVLPRLSLQNCPAGVKVLDLQPKKTRTIGLQYKKDSVSEVTENFIEHMKDYMGNL